MNIGQAAKLSGMNAKTIRYYEHIDLLHPARRSVNGYRDYSEQDIERLRFLNRARKTGFNIDECRQLISLLNDRSRQSQNVKSLVMEKASHVAAQIEELQAMHQTLLDLASECQSNDKPQCGILDELCSKTVSDKGDI